MIITKFIFLKVLAQAYGSGNYGAGLYGTGEEKVIDLPGNLPDTGTEMLVLLAAVVAIGSGIMTYRRLAKKRQS